MRLWSRVRSLALIAVFASVGCTDAPNERAPHAGTDVVIVLIDTLRPDHLGFYGHERETAPFLAERALNAALFDRAYSTSSWTAPATASLFTGLYPKRHGVVAGFFVEDNKPGKNSMPVSLEMSLSRLPATIPGIASLLGEAGYRTYGIATNTHISPELGFDSGFDRFAYLRKATVEEVSATLREWAPGMLASPDPTFLYLHLNDVHGPYKRHAPWYQEKRDSLRDEISAYDSGISYLDAGLEKIATELDWNDDTLFVVVSDHGEEFREHGGIHHRGGLHQELTRVLLMISGPGIKAQRITTDVSLIDVLPTTLELAGIDLPLGRDGVSLVPLLAGDPPSTDFTDRVLFAHRLEKAKRFGDETWAAIRGRWKLIDGVKGTELFDLDNDFFEQTDRLAQQPKEAGALRSRLFDFENQRHELDEDTTVPIAIDSEMRQHLEELGYVDDGGGEKANSSPESD